MKAIRMQSFPDWLNISCFFDGKKVIYTIVMTVPLALQGYTLPKMYVFCMTVL